MSATTHCRTHGIVELVQTTHFLAQNYAECEGTIIQARKFRHENIHENKMYINLPAQLRYI
jgi:hypothetical protein